MSDERNPASPTDTQTGAPTAGNPPSHSNITVSNVTAPHYPDSNGHPYAGYGQRVHIPPADAETAAALTRQHFGHRPPDDLAEVRVLAARDGALATLAAQHAFGDHAPSQQESQPEPVSATVQTAPRPAGNASRKSATPSRPPGKPGASRSAAQAPGVIGRFTALLAARKAADRSRPPGKPPSR